MFKQFLQTSQELGAVSSIDDTMIKGPVDGCSGLLAELTVHPDPARLYGADGEDARLRRIEDGRETRDGILANIGNGERPVFKNFGIKLPSADLRDVGGIGLRERGNVFP